MNIERTIYPLDQISSPSHGLPTILKNYHLPSDESENEREEGYRNKYLLANKQQDDETDLQYLEKE